MRRELIPGSLFDLVFEVVLMEFMGLRLVFMLSVLVCVFSGCGLLSGTAYFEGWKDSRFTRSEENILGYIKKHPEHVSLVAYDISNRSEGIYYNQHSLRPLASTIKILVAVEYARQLELGLVQADELIPTDSILLFHIPFTDGGAHKAAARSYKAKAKNGRKTIPLEQVVLHMTRFSDNAATDYLIHRLGRDHITRTARRFGLSYSDPPSPINGRYLSYTTFDANPSDTLIYEMTDRFLNKRFYRRWKKWTTPLASTFGLGFYGQRKRSKHFSAGTAFEYADLLARVCSDSLMSPAVSRKTFDLLAKAPVLNDSTGVSAIRGGKGGAIAGVLTRASFFEESNDQSRGVKVVVLFIDGMSFTAWNMMLKTRSFSRFVYRLQEDPLFYSALKESLSQES